MTCLLCFLAACQPRSQQQNIVVSLVSDGRERIFQYTSPVTVEQFLFDANAEWDDNDRISHPLFTQITDGMRVTLVRVEETIECQQEEIPYERSIVPSEGLAPNEERLVQAGKNGVQEICFRTITEDGRPGERVRVGQPTIIIEPEDEVIFIGITESIEPIPIWGTLAYINNGNAWVIKGTSTAKRNLTTEGLLDSHVFALSEDGRYLLYTDTNTGDDNFFNQLWLIETSENSQSVKLVPTDVLYADWVPGRANTISYSTGEKQQLPPFWKAFNNLSIIRIDLQTGATLSVEPLIGESLGGLYGWWGTVYEWSPDGRVLAWVRADSLGMVDLESGELLPPILNYPVFNTAQDWSWRANVSWSWDGERLATIIHGPPLGTEPPENSPVFNLLVTNPEGDFEALVYDSVGMWATPKFSPQVTRDGDAFPRGYLAYLRSRRPHNSRTGDYDLVVADRDGSNARVVFPDPNLPGITSSDFGLTPQNFTWSPNGQQIAVVYQGNLWVVDVESGASYQLTFDGRSSNPVWK